MLYIYIYIYTYVNTQIHKKSASKKSQELLDLKAAHRRALIEETEKMSAERERSESERTQLVKKVATLEQALETVKDANVSMSIQNRDANLGGLGTPLASSVASYGSGGGFDVSITCVCVCVYFCARFSCGYCCMPCMFVCVVW
jgi:hypothetical protein